MRLLFDHNLSPRLVRRLADLYPDASHVASLGLEQASDVAVWSFAQANGYVIVTKDSDFSDMSVLRGFPPKVVWLRMGNCTTHQIEAALRAHHATLTRFAADLSAGVLLIS